MIRRNSSLKSPIITITVEDIDDAIGKVKKNGGKVVNAKFKVDDMGYSAYIEDSEKNVIGLWQTKRRM